MAERIDHAAEAATLLENYAPDYTVAMVHATLALVEQQRIANLIAYWQLHTPRSAAEAVEYRHIEVRVIDAGEQDIDVVVREGLGL